MAKVVIARQLLAITLLFSIERLAIADDSLTVSIIDYPPISYYDYAANTGRGVVADIVAEALTAGGLTPTFTPMPMARSVWSLNEGQYRATIGLDKWFQHAGRGHLIDRVDILNLNFVFFYKRQRFPQGIQYQQLEELNNYSIGNVRGSVTTELVTDADLKVHYLTEIEQNFLMLESGRIDLAIAVEFTGWHIIQENFPGRQDEFAATEQSMFSYPVSFIFSKTDTVLKEAFKKGMNHIYTNGRYTEILKNYLPEH
ncbi:substrate-binding periplasmic protein [Reinekea marinisedimentorum]|uniref:Polar amino acid transport system substrate-binding protein n=1 Tax=Reinekea marinisedimentorum TaxID=230495 RepID=A0A4R3I8G6_9GAMM|nr:transporter substrate-binding domain-containing protein [Reinekea marinisedimentorum]TCS41621.1 polar amino acid transport system substrate-binding protein [Reinekea marinisedimentorum]